MEQIGKSVEGAGPANGGLIGAVLPYRAVLFDMDGVVTDTAELHDAAWKQLFDSVLRDPRLGGSTRQDEFDAEFDYRRYVDGRNREDGVEAFLASRNIQLPLGIPSDAPDAWTIHGLATRKNGIFLEMLDQRGVRAYPGTTALLDRLRAGGIPVGLVTASRNARAILAAAQLDFLFDVIVDGDVAAELRLPGKPDPAMFLEAAHLLNVRPEQVVVIEDAVAGVAAGRRGNFGLVVGIDRGEHRDEFEAAGANLILEDVSELDLGSSRIDPWVLVYDGFDPEHEGHREALTVVGNGYMATRGANPENADDGIHYPGTYLSGIYNRLVSTVHNRQLEEEQLVNIPNWLPVDLRIDDGPWWSDGQLSAHGERHELDLRTGILARHITLTDANGRSLALIQRRMVSMHNPHLATLETTFTPLGWEGKIGVRSGIDATVLNTNVRTYVDRAARHLQSPTFVRIDDDTMLCQVHTSQSQIGIAVAVRTLVNGKMSADISRTESGRYHRQFDLQVAADLPAKVTKTVAIGTSRDPAIASAGSGALAQLSRSANGIDGLRTAHEAAWRDLWERFSVRMDADTQSQLVLNLHLFHLLQAISPHTAAIDAGVPARGLHGEGYRGHVFWDELFVMPVVGLRLPNVSAALLAYRWNRLDAARDAARAVGLSGAMFPWQSGSDGREETPQQLYNVRSASWMPDNSHLQRHVGLAVAYNAWQHYQITGDTQWLLEQGAELIIEVTRMFSSLATYDLDEDRFHVSGVMGPDEYHDGHPHSLANGLTDNAYTNVLLSWVCGRAADALNAVTGHMRNDLLTRLSITPDEVSLWSRLSRRLAVHFHDDGIISQFDGYAKLIEFDWRRYRAKYGNIGRLDLILKAENDTTNRYKLSKQADVLMLVHLLGLDGLREQLRQLGYRVSEGDLRRTVDYYLARTANGSTLSRVVHASVLAHVDETRAWAAFRQALVADLDDTQGGTTREGIHLGAMAGSADLVIRAFAGLRTVEGALTFAPNLPPRVDNLCFQILYRGQRVNVSLNHQRLHLQLPACGANPIRIGVRDRFVVMSGGEEREFTTISPSDHHGAISH